MSLPTLFFVGRANGQVIVSPSSFFGVQGVPILNSFGFEMYTGDKSNIADGTSVGSYDTATFTVPPDVTKIRAVCIGGGGGAKSNVIGAGGGAGIEAFIEVTGGETLTLQVGKGGRALSTTSTGQARGGVTRIIRSGQTLLEAFGGRSGYDTSISSYGRATATTSGYPAGVTIISAASGGYNNTNATFDSTSQKSPVVTISPTLAGAVPHAAGAGSYYDNGTGVGMGFGGGGGNPSAGGTYGEKPSQGGCFGYAGGWGTSNDGQAALGPTGPTTFQNTGGNSASGQDKDTLIRGANNGSNSYLYYEGGCGGGAFGGGGAEAFDGGEGASGLIRIWWADAEGNSSWIDEGSNYIERIYNQPLTRTLSYDGTQTYGDTFPIAKRFFEAGGETQLLSDCRVTSFSIEFDCYLDPSFINNNQWIVSAVQGYSNYIPSNALDEGILIGFNQNKFSVAGKNLGAYGIASTSTYSSGTYNVRLEKSNNTYALYVDNVFQGSGTGANGAYLSHLVTGIAPSSPRNSLTNPFKGTITNLQVTL